MPCGHVDMAPSVSARLGAVEVDSLAHHTALGAQGVGSTSAALPGRGRRIRYGLLSQVQTEFPQPGQPSPYLA